MVLKLNASRIMKKSIIAITAFSMAAAFGHAQVQTSNPSAAGQQQRQNQPVRSTTDSNMGQSTEKQARAQNKELKDKDHLSRSGSHRIKQVQSDMHQQRLQSSDLVGAKVTNNQDRTIGTVSNLEVSERGQIEAVYIDIGGILGIGSTTYRVPFSALQISSEGDKQRLTLDRGTITELAAVSEDLRKSMEEWAEDDAEELADRSQDALNRAADRTSATGITGTTRTDTLGERVERGAENAGDSIRRGANNVADGARDLGNKISTEARELMDNLRGEFQDQPEVAAELTNVNLHVDQQNRLVLEGQVSSEDAKDSILDAAEDISNGREIVDNLRISGSSRVSADY